MALYYARAISSSGIITDIDDVLFGASAVVYGPPPTWVNVNLSDQTSLDSDAPFPLRIVHDFEVVTNGLPHTMTAHVFYGAEEFVTSIGSFGSGIHVVRVRTDDIFTTWQGALEPFVIEVHTGDIPTVTVLTDGTVQIHSIEPEEAQANPRWWVGIIPFPSGRSGCFTAAIEEEVVAPGGDVGQVPIPFTVTVTPQSWATAGEPITIVPQANEFDPTSANFRIRVQGWMDCNDVVQIQCNASNGGPIASEVSGDIGPGDFIPLDIVFDLDLNLTVGNTYFFDFDLLDPNGGGAFFYASPPHNGTVTFCYTTLPG